MTGEEVREVERQLDEERYEVYDRTFSVARANKQALIWGGVIFIVTMVAFVAVWGPRGNGFSELLWIGLTIFAFIFLHELLHAAGYILAGKVKAGDVKLGVFWKKLTPYAHCKVPIRAEAYRFAVILPVILGIGPLLYAFAAGSYFWMMVGTIMLIGSTGDWMIVRSIREFDRDAFVEDHPEEIGCRVYVKK
ncbi:DUF3267 domain-containing protein [Alteribacter lacisalsi]|nr:DUF3267 domain-containing protein [Alteribacter lacisalsi]